MCVNSPHLLTMGWGWMGGSNLLGFNHIYMSPPLVRNDSQPKQLTAETTHQKRLNRLAPKFGPKDPQPKRPTAKTTQIPGFNLSQQGVCQNFDVVCHCSDHYRPHLWVMYIFLVQKNNAHGPIWPYFHSPHRKRQISSVKCLYFPIVTQNVSYCGSFY